MRILIIAAALLCVLPVAAKTINVGPSAEYTDINSALSAASSGDVVSVAAGYYGVPDGVDIETDNITLKGAGADQTILDGMDKAYAVVSAKANGVTVTGFTLQNGSSHGFYASENNYGTLSYCVITGCKDRGILLGSGEPYAVIDHNTFANNQVSTIYSYRDDARTKFTNNISYENGRAIVTDSTMSHMTVKYNCFWGQSNDSEATRTSKTNFRADPLFVNTASDFHLQEGSPCLGKGEKESNIGALGTGTNPVIEKPVTAKTAGEYRIVVRTHDGILGKQVLDVLITGGFGNSESCVTDLPDGSPGMYVTTAPVVRASIQYGAADEDDISAIHKLVSALYEDEIEESNEFDSDDYDVFINLP
jgi:hypothetical protein